MTGDPVSAPMQRTSAMDRDYTYRLRDTDDPEERLEDAAMFKALYDASGGKVKATKEGVADFGADGSMFKHTIELPYFDDPAFLKHVGREFTVCTWDGVADAVKRLHGQGKGAFVKSAFQKYFIAKIDVGQSVQDIVGEMAYSFIDSPAPLMVQEFVDFTFEHRFFCVGRKIVASSPAAYKLTPIDFPLAKDLAWRKQADDEPEPFWKAHVLRDIAKDVAINMVTPDATIDVGMIGERAAVVELNPFRAGMVGLFASDVRAIARAALSAIGGQDGRS